MTLTPAQAGFLKGLILSVLFAVLAFLGDSANLSGVIAPTLAALISAVASSIESSLKAKSGGSSALFGAVRLK